MRPILVIPARLAATRLPDKPLAPIAGRPMIAHVIDRAREAGLGPVLVAAGDAAIVDAARAAGAEAVLTDPALPRGTDRVAAALAQVDPERRFDPVVNLQGDLPILDPGIPRATLQALASNPWADIATPVAPIEDEAEAAREQVVKCVVGFADGALTARALYFSRAAIPWGGGFAAQWHHIGLYAFRRAALDRFVSLAESPLERLERLEQLRGLEAGMGIVAVRVPAAPFGVDTPADLERARAILEPRPGVADHTPQGKQR